MTRREPSDAPSGSWRGRDESSRLPPSQRAARFERGAPPTEGTPRVAAPTVLVEGRHDAIVIKPAGMSVELRVTAGAASGDPSGDPSLLAWARRRWPDSTPRLPHRLDRIARGIVVVALTREAAAFHSAMIAQRRWSKYYLARIDARSVDPNQLLGPHRVYLRTRGRRAEVVRSGGDPASLAVLAAAPAPPTLAPRDRPLHGTEATTSWHLLIKLETGRFHQIRATLAHLGAPIAGDPIYDPRAGRTSSIPYLEHVVLRLPVADAALGIEEGGNAANDEGPALRAEPGQERGGNDDRSERTVWWPSDPDRESLDPTMASAIAALVTPQPR